MYSNRWLLFTYPSKYLIIIMKNNGQKVTLTVTYEMLMLFDLYVKNSNSNFGNSIIACKAEIILQYFIIDLPTYCTWEKSCVGTSWAAEAGEAGTRGTPRKTVGWVVATWDATARNSGDLWDQLLCRNITFTFLKVSINKINLFFIIMGGIDLSGQYPSFFDEDGSFRIVSRQAWPVRFPAPNSSCWYTL